MNRPVLAIVAAALSLTTAVACSAGPSADELREAAAAACEPAIKDFAKHPREAELIDPIEGTVRPADDGQGPKGTTQYSVNFGVAAFKNSFGVASDYNYGCVTYHDDSGNVLDTQVKVKKDSGPLSRIAYSASTDELL